jgi:hypothetical protein
MADELTNVPPALTPAPAQDVDDGLAADLETDPVDEAYFKFIMEHFNALPVSIRDYLNSSRVAGELRAIYKEFNLSADDREIAYAIVLKVFFGMVKPADFADTLWTELEWEDSEEDRCRRLVISLIGRVLLPAQSFLGDLTGVLTEFGGKVGDYSTEQIELRVISYDEGAREIANAVDLPFDEEGRIRLSHIIASRLRDVRDEMETKEMLMRSKKVGGMELDETAAEYILNFIKQKAQLTKYVEYVDKSEMVRDALGPTQEASLPTGDMSVVVTPAGQELPAVAPAEAVVEPPAPSVGGLSAADIKAIYSGSEEERADLAKRIAKFREVTASDPDRERDALNEILYPPDLGPVEPLFVVAAVLAMADDGALPSALADDMRIREMINKYLVDRRLQSVAFRFAEKPGDQEFMNIFLQLMLRAFAGLSDAEAARFGLRASRAMKKAGYLEYDGFVAFDADTKAFRWLKPIEL